MSTQCLFGSSIIILTIQFTILIVFIIQFSIFNSFELKDCNLSNIYYPNYSTNELINKTNKNIINMTQQYGYIKCGDKKYQTCISLYGYLNNIYNNNSNTFIFNNLSDYPSYQSDKYCTFRESKCVEYFSNNDLNKTIQRANEYKKYLSNKTVDCWTDKDNKDLYLHNNEYVNIIVFPILGSLIGVILIIIGSCYIYYRKNEYTLFNN